MNILIWCSKLVNGNRYIITHTNSKVRSENFLLQTNVCEKDGMIKHYKWHLSACQGDGRNLTVQIKWRPNNLKCPKKLLINNLTKLLTCCTCRLRIIINRWIINTCFYSQRNNIPNRSLKSPITHYTHFNPSCWSFSFLEEYYLMLTESF